MTPSSRGEAGFTLIELMVTLAILGIVMTAMTTAMILSLRTVKSTDDRFTESNDRETSAAYFANDVQSATAVNVSNCGGGSPAITFWSTDYTKPDQMTTFPTVKVVSYSVITVSTVKKRLVRRECVGTAPVTERVIAGSLANTTPNPSLACVPSPCSSSATGVTMTVTDTAGTAGSSYSLAGQRRRT